MKYRSERTPEIRITVEENGGEWRFSVADNGIDFDPIYAEKIFGMFKRLHGNGDYEGTGIGLSQSKKDRPPSRRTDLG